MYTFNVIHVGENWNGSGEKKDLLHVYNYTRILLDLDLFISTNYSKLNSFSIGIEYNYGCK